MLVLSRKINESVFVGDSEVVVIEIKNGIVRLGFKAPKEVSIRRDVHYHADKRRESEAAK